MLKITSIVSSIIFLLFLGAGSYARTLVDQEQQKATATTQEEEQKDDFDEEPSESVHRLDFYHGFSLVNAQLRWKEFEMEKQGKSLKDFSRKETVAQNTIVEVTEMLDVQVQIIAVPTPTFEKYISLDDNRTFSVNASCKNLKLQASTIAFIQNCGTYPHLLS